MSTAVSGDINLVNGRNVHIWKVPSSNSLKAHIGTRKHVEVSPERPLGGWGRGSQMPADVHLFPSFRM